MLFLRGHQGPVRALAYAPGDVRTLASAGDDGTARLWNPLTGQNWATFRAYPAGGHALAFSPDGGLLATGDRDATVCLWDVALQRQWAHLRMRRPGAVSALAFTPDGATLLAGSQYDEVGGSGLLQSFSVGAGEDAEHIPWPGGVGRLVLSGGGEVIVAGSRRWHVTRLAHGTWARLPPVRRFRAPITGLDLLPGGTEDGPAVVVAAGRLVEYWPPGEGARLSRFQSRSEVRGIALAPDGGRLLCACRDGTVRVWDVAARQQRAAYDWQLGRLHAVAYAPDGMTAAAAGERPDIVVWDVDDA